MTARENGPYSVPIELVRRLVGPTGAMLLLRARSRGLTCASIAIVSVMAGKFVADVSFLGDPAPPGLRIMLGVGPDA